MANIYIDNTHLIGDISRKYGCDLGVAKDRLKADLKSGKDGETGGLIPPELREQVAALGPEGLAEAEEGYREWIKEQQAFGKAFDPTPFA